MIVTDKKIEKPQRRYFSEDLDISSWEEVKPLLEEMTGEALSSEGELRKIR